MLFCEFRLNLTQTSSHDWHVQLFVKDPLQVRTGRPLRIMTAHNLAVLSVVLETFQTYYAFSRAVNPSISIDTGEHRALKRATCRSSWLCGRFPRAKALERLNLVKDLVLEVPRFPLTCRRTLSSTSSPVAGAATTELYCLRCQLLLQDSKHLHPLATTTPLADLIIIADTN